MRKFTLLVIVAMVPYFTMAQKRSKKGKKDVETVASYEFMIITGYEIMIDEVKKIKDGPDHIQSPKMQLKRMMKANSKVEILFDFGGNNSDENTLLSENRYKSMSHAVNAAANKGWEFHSSNVLAVGAAKIHYYYMKRNK